MFEAIITLIIILFFTSIPILLWGYIFSYIEWWKLSRKRFILGLCGGAISVIPILFIDVLLESPWFNILNIFSKITEVYSFSWFLNFNISLILFMFILAWVAFIAISWSHKSKKVLQIYLKNILLFIGFIFLLSMWIYAFSASWLWYWEVLNSVSFWETLFNTLKLIIFYYILVAFIEEASKHFNFLQSNILDLKTVQEGVLYAIFIALWFALIENILYLYSWFQQSWMTFELAQTYFYRSIFSVMLHVMCSSIVWYAFSKAYIESQQHFFSWAYIRIFFIWLFVWILLHVIFDVALTLWFSFIIIIYFIVWYLYVSSIFYRE